MGATKERIHSPTRPTNLSQRASPAAFTVMTRCVMAHQILHPHTRCCGDQMKVQSADMATTQAMPRLKAPLQLEEKTGQAALLRRILSTTAFISAQNHELPRTNLQTETQQMIGQNISALLERNTITTVELRSPSGRSPKTCWRENNDKKTPPRLWQTVSPETWTIDKRPCRTKLHQRPLQETSPHHPTLAIPHPLLVRA